MRAAISKGKSALKNRLVRKSQSKYFEPDTCVLIKNTAIKTGLMSIIRLKRYYQPVARRKRTSQQKKDYPASTAASIILGRVMVKQEPSPQVEVRSMRPFNLSSVSLTI